MDHHKIIKTLSRTIKKNDQAKIIYLQLFVCNLMFNFLISLHSQPQQYNLTSFVSRWR